ncbi:MAG: hypothetical protein KJ737_17735 [Proteobacteria bacterium]|nr:hypothetical protein [Pseudomonadota bacterium]
MKSPNLYLFKKKIKLINRYSAICASLFFIVMTFWGCGSTTLKASKPDRITGYFMDKSESNKGTIVIDEKIPINDYKRLLYIQPNNQHFMNDKAQDIDTFAKNMVESINFFDQVADQSEFKRLLIKTGIAYKVSNISDLIGLYQVQKLFGNYLVAALDFKLTAPHLDGTNSVANLKIIDPSTMKIVYHVEHRAFVVHGFDQPLLFPLFNSLIDWIKRNSVY